MKRPDYLARRDALRRGGPSPAASRPVVVDDAYVEAETVRALPGAAMVFARLDADTPGMTAGDVDMLTDLEWQLAASLAGVEADPFVRRAVRRLAAERDAVNAGDSTAAFRGLPGCG